MLPLLAVLIFAIMGIAALSVDVGLAFATQARLASAAPALAMERARFIAETAAGPTLGDPVAAWNERGEALLERLLGPAALGTEATSGLRLESATPDTWNGDLTESRTEAALSGWTPLLFGMAALLPTTVEANGQQRGALSVSELNARRAQGDLTPQLSSGGLRGTGFAPLGKAAVRYRPVARVGAANGDLGLPGLAPVALFDGEGEGEEEIPTSLEIDDESGEVITSDDDVVGCVIDARRTASVGPYFPLGAVDPSGIESTALAYAPVLAGAPPDTPCPRGEQAVVEIIGFVAVAVAVSLPDYTVQRLGEGQIPRVLVNTSTLPAHREGIPRPVTGLGEPLQGPAFTAPSDEESG